MCSLNGLKVYTCVCLRASCRKSLQQEGLAGELRNIPVHPVPIRISRQIAEAHPEPTPLGLRETKQKARQLRGRPSELEYQGVGEVINR